MSHISLLITSFSPFPTIPLSLPSHLPIASLSTILSPLCPPSQQSLSTLSSPLPAASLPLSTLTNDTDGGPITVRLAVRLPGGKGGFASQLRAQGGRMSSNKATNNDSCRDLNGRRMSTIKEAQKLAAYLSSATDREAAATKAAQEKLAALEAEIVKLGGGEDGGNKRKLDDHKFVEESREMVEGVKDAVKLAMLKKKKKAKLDNAAASSSTSTPVPAVEEKPVEEKLAEETPDASSSTGDAAPADAAVEPAAPVEVEAEAETEAGKEEKPKGKGKGRATRAKK